MAELAAPARHAAHSAPMAGLARFGLAARAFVYLVVGWLGLQIALGKHPHQANQRGALAEVARGSVGLALLWVIAFGLAGYALWRLSAAAFGGAGAATKGDRAQWAWSGVVYAALCVSTIKFIAGTSRTGQAQQQETLTARVLRDDLGRWLVGAVGVVVIGSGVYMAVEGALRRFERQLRMYEMSPRTERAVSRLGVIGSVGRGVVFAVVGGLVVAAAVTADPHKSTGLDGALRTLAGEPYGRWLVGALALGLIVFAAFGFAEARWTKT